MKEGVAFWSLIKKEDLESVSPDSNLRGLLITFAMIVVVPFVVMSVIVIV